MVTLKDAAQQALVALEIYFDAYPQIQKGYAADVIVDLRDVVVAIVDLRAALAEQQEPVACKHNRYSVDVREQTGKCYDCGAEGRMKFVVDDTTPQPKADKWVGLSDADLANCDTDEYETARYWERVLKAKNAKDKT